jgi:hypothetical protein
MARIELVVAFDAQEEPLELRVELTRQVIDRLADQQFFDGDVPEVVGYSDRAQCLGRVAGSQRVLLIADMNARREHTIGNQGARILRAVAQNFGAETYRVLWTRFDLPTVASGIASWAHALVRYDSDRGRRLDLLEQAIRHVLAGDPEPRGPFAQFSGPIDDRPREQQMQEAVVNKLLRGGRLRDGEMLAVGSILQGAPDVWINTELKKAYDAGGGNRELCCPSVNDFLRRISDDVEDARERVYRTLSDYAETDVNTLLTPRIVFRAEKAQGFSWRRTRVRTWLTEAEDELARTFFDVHTRLLDAANAERAQNGKKPLPPNADLEHKVVLDRAAEHHEVAQVMADHDFGPDDLNYAVFSFVDAAGSVREPASVCG